MATPKQRDKPLFELDRKNMQVDKPMMQGEAIEDENSSYVDNE